MAIKRVEITREDYRKMTGHSYGCEFASVIHSAPSGEKLTQYVFVDELDTAPSEVAWLDELYKL